MLQNVKISRQIMGGFALILLMLIAFAGFTWERLSSLNAAHGQAGLDGWRALTSADINHGVTEADRTLLRFLDTATQENADQIIAAMEHVRQLAMKAADQGNPDADRLIELKERHLEEARSFGAAYLEQAAQLQRVAEMETEQRVRLGRLQERMLARNDNARALIASEADKTTLLIMNSLGLRLGDQDDAASARLAQLHTALLAQLSKLAAGPLDFEDRQLVSDSQTASAEIWSIVEAAHANEPSLRSQLAALRQTSSEVLALTDGMRLAAVTAADEHAAEAEALSQTTVLSVLLGVALTVLAGTVIAVSLSQGLARRLGRTVEQTTRLAKGDLGVSITGHGGRNELAEMARALVVFKDNALERQHLAAESQRIQTEAAATREAELKDQSRVVQDIGDGLARLAQGDLTREIDSPADDPFPAGYEALRKAFNSVLATLSHTVLEIGNVADQVRGGSDEITSAAQDLSGRAETQAATLEESAAALTEMSESVRLTAERAQQAEHASRQNREIAEASATVVRDAISAMNGIKAYSDQITRIISVIEDIGFQTNLLALNAGVEAARAGEAGRGFAVVASEVRGLAQRASESAREIKTLISDSAAQVQAGSALVERTGASLEAILGKAQEVSQQVSQIALAASEQATGLSEINAGVNQLDQVTQQNAAVAEEANAAAVSLQERAEDLMHEIARFRVSKDAHQTLSPTEKTTPNSIKSTTVPLRVVGGRLDRLGQFLEF